MLGILGGMGPLATADFQRKLALAVPAERDQDHVPIITWGDPRVPDRPDAILRSGPSPLPALEHGARSLVAAGAGAIAMPCTTAHFWSDAIERAIAPAPLIHIVDAVANEAAARGVRRLGLLGTTAMAQAGIYQRRVERFGLTIVAPDAEAQDAVQSAILAIKRGRVVEAERALRPQAAALLERGAEAIALACTEIPIALADGGDGRLIDASAALARACVDWWRLRPA